jgi:hypothetical protein
MWENDVILVWKHGVHVWEGRYPQGKHGLAMAQPNSCIFAAILLVSRVLWVVLRHGRGSMSALTQLLCTPAAVR